MNPNDLTKQNENLVRQWFEESGFEATKLDTDNTANADWAFSKSDSVVICEVKTIFSGGIGRGKEGREDIRGTYRHFVAEFKRQLESDPEIGNLPFDVTLAIDALYVPSGVQIEVFKAWVKQQILNVQDAPAIQHLQGSFVFDEVKVQSRIRSIEAHVQLAGPFTGSGLFVQELAGGTPPNYKKFEDTIREAVVEQIRSSLMHRQTQNSIAAVALWSASEHLPPFGWLLGMFLDEQERYNLFDWAFKEYPELSAILLFEQISSESVCFLITSPFLPEYATQLKQLITNSPVRFVDGIIEPIEPNS